MPVAIDEYQAGPIESRGVRMLRVCGSRTCTPEGAAPCDDCRIGPASLCAAQSEVGGAVVPPFRISGQWFPAGHDIVEAGEAGHEFWLIVDGWAVQYELREEGMLILKRGVLRLLDPGRLAEIAGLDDHRVGRRPTSKMSILPHRTVQREPARQRARGIFDTG